MLEITQPASGPMKPFYGVWFNHVVPALGKVLDNSAYGMMSGASGLLCAAATASSTPPCRATVNRIPAKFRRELAPYDFSSPIY